MNAALLLSAILNGAWQGSLLCLAALLAFRLFRRLNATTMFAVWSVLLALAVSLPVANYVFAPGVVRVQAQGDMGPAQSGAGRVPVMLSLSKHEQAGNSAGVPLRRAQGDMGRVRGDEVAIRPDMGWVRDRAVAIGRDIFDYAWMILAALALIALVRLAALARDVVMMLKARARVRAIEAPVTLADGIGRAFGFAASDEFSSPCVLGFAPPLIVIPEELLAEPNAELTSVVLHEREHVRRFDDVQNVLQRVVGALAFFCPGVRIALRELALYREQICDDAAVNATGDRVSYAMTLTGMAQWAQGRGAPVPSLIFKRKHLLHRLEVLLDSAVSHSMRMNRRFAVGAVTALVLAAALVLRFQVPVIAETMGTVSASKHVRAGDSALVALRQAQGDKGPAAHAKGAVPVVVSASKHESVGDSALVALRQAQGDKGPGQRDKGIAQGDKGPAQRDKGPAPSARVANVAPEAASAIAVARVAASRVAAASGVAVSAPVVAAGWHTQSNDLLDALSSAGMRNLSVDQLIALRDHGVSADLVRAAVSYFGRVGASDLTYLADHGVGTSYIATLRASGVNGISPQAAVELMDHGVSAPLISAATGYFSPRPSATNLVSLADHGVSSNYLAGLHSAGLSASVADVIRLFDRGVWGADVAKIRRVNPHASIDDIIRLHDAGF